VLACGVVGGVSGGIFARILIAFGKGLPGRPGVWIRTHPIAFAASCGLSLAILGLISGGTTYGTGYDETRALLAGAPTSASWGPLKMLATVISYASGIPGGIFSPSLAVGAGIGKLLSGWMPLVPVSTIVILCMAAYFTGTVQAPITAVVIVMEMTDNQSMTIPLMATALIALGVSRWVCPQPFYKAMAEGFMVKPAMVETLPR
jgi:H+/Cl- antiporter ClcA